MTTNMTTMNGLFDAEYFDIHSNNVQDTFRIFVAKPALLKEGLLYPTIFALDGNAAFASLTSTQRMLTQGAEVPPSFVIGIGYPGDTLAAAMANRNRDYAPTNPGEAETRALGTTVQAGAKEFLGFIQDELIPILSSQYPIELQNLTLQGTSLGGLFAAWVLLARPTIFNKYIMASPAIWWRNEQIWDWESSYAENNEDLQATVFLGAGELEVAEHLRTDAQSIAQSNPHMKDYIEGVIAWNDQNGWPEVAKLAPQFAQRLRERNYPGLVIHCHNMPDENHMSAAPSLTTRGLRYVNGSWHPS